MDLMSGEFSMVRCLNSERFLRADIESSELQFFSTKCFSFLAFFRLLILRIFHESDSSKECRFFKY